MANEIYNTTWWGNAIDTAITAGTEPDFFGSQMKMLTSQQPEEVTNGDFSDGSTGWVLLNISYTEPNNFENTGTNGKVQQLLGLTIGRKYIVNYDFDNVGNWIVHASTTSSSGGSIGTSGAATNEGGSFVFTATYRSSIGTYTEYVTNGSTSTFFVQGNASFIGSIDNVSIKLARAEEVEAVKCLADWIHTTALQDLNN